MVSPFLAGALFFKDTVFEFLPENTISRPTQTEGDEIEINNELFLAASKALSSWIQVWMDEPTPRLTPSSKEK